MKILYGEGDKNFVEVTVQKVCSTEKAIKAIYDNEEGFWLPKCFIEDEEIIKDNLIKLIIPEWLAIEKDII